MGSPGDQAGSDVSRTLPPGAPRSPGGPLAGRFEDHPPKTPPQEPQPPQTASGPEFDFSAPAVREREEALREAARALEVSLQVPLEDRGGDGGYAAAAEALEAAVPEFHARYQAYVDAVIATGSAKVTCARGCGHCCSHYVSSVEPFELIRLHRIVRRHPDYPGRLIAFHRRVSAYTSLLGGRLDEESDDRALYRYYLRNMACPFLTSAGECGVYAERPMSCRMFFSQSHPSLCRGKATTSPGNRNFIVELPDDIEAMVGRASARLARFELPDSLFGGLLEANARFGPFDGE